MIKFFVAPLFSKEPPLKLLAFDFIDRVETPEVADFIVVPQYVRRTNPKVLQYLNAVRELGIKTVKPVLALKGGDLSYRFSLPGVTVFASSMYKSQNTGEIAMPAPVEDLSALPFTARHKRERPTLSFCGYADFSSIAEHAKYAIKNALTLFSPQYRRGIYWRRLAMSLLSNDTRIATNFIIRNKFSGKLGKTVGEKERNEYLQNILESDFVLCPKGDANYSTRFYETLALGRIPVLIDTEMVLPLEDLIDYSKFIVRVPFRDVKNIGTYIIDRWNALSGEEYVAMQHRAREVFQNYLRYDSFFKTALTLLKEKGPAKLMADPL